jgi:hypothetical protein
MLFVPGFGLVLAGAVLALARDSVIRNVTSKPLGSLPPGYAATRGGYFVYAALVIDLGALVLAIAVGSVPLAGIPLLGFIGGSLVVLVGEVRTYRALKR